MGKKADETDGEEGEIRSFSALYIFSLPSPERTTRRHSRSKTASSQDGETHYAQKEMLQWEGIEDC